MLLRANASELLWPGLDEVLFEKWKEKNPMYKEIYNVKTSKKKYEKTLGFSGFGNLVEKPEGQDMTTDDPIQGYETTFTHKTYALEARITDEMEDDDLYDVIKRLPPALANSAMRTKEIYAAAVFNNGFSVAGSTYMSGGDGQVLFYASHPLTGGGTQTNVLGTAADLSVTSLEEALYTLRQTVGDRGEILSLEPKTLLVPTQLGRVAFELTKSAGRPDTANRADNWLKEQGLTYKEWAYLTDTDAWFVLCGSDQHTLLWYERRELSTDMDRAFHSKDHLYSVDCRWSNGYEDFRGTFGSPGA
jgi:phage major head subunit gpT-like protein